MKKLGILLFVLMSFSFLGQAGEVYGTIKGNDGKPLTKQVVQILLNEKVIASDTTDINGYFSVKIKEVGKLKLVIIGFKGASFDVFSANSATRYNLSMIKADDKWILKSQ